MDGSYRLSKLDWIGLLRFCGSSGVILYPELPLGTLAAKALMFAKSVPLRLGSHASRVPATAFVSVGLGGDYPLVRSVAAWAS